ncbi:MAG TPA: M24 family metallopeptidase [Candidatus Dormibacteraeota bacterium]|nr:M24 family metallopeptidase [Candidatus Dormibacteraeota bacterium]
MTGYPRFSAGEFGRRHAAMRELVDSSSLQAVLLYGNRAAHNEIQYLTNHAVAFEGMLLFPAKGDPILWVHYANHVATARALSTVEDVRWAGDDVAETAGAELKLRGLASSRIGIGGPLTQARWSALRRTCPEAELVDIQPQLTRQRLVKSQEEIAWTRRGAALSDLAVEALVREARPGLSEHQLAAIVQNAYYAEGGRTHIHYLGATPMSAPALCSPAQVQSSRRLLRGDVILTELSAMHHGYWGQVLRSITVSAEPTAEYERMHDVALSTFNRIVSKLRDGATSDELLEIAEDIHQAGYTICDDLVHMAVGGVYSPYLRTRATTAGEPPAITYRENMLVVVQPNVVTKDLRMGVQVGEMVRVTRTGAERLHRAPLGFLRCG